jgi:Bacterial protein of unknown function (DUF839)
MTSSRTYFLSAVTLTALSVTVVAQSYKLSLVGNPVEKVESQAADTVMSAEFTQEPVARGSMKLENPTAILTHYGYAADGPMVPATGDKQSKDHNVEASKTEPDKNTFLVLNDQTGPDANFNYGTQFLFQGHEAGAVLDKRPQGYLTRINLQADEAHRVTLMADKDSSGATLPFLDGSTWNPLAQRLLLTGEEGDEGGVWQATASFPAKVDNLTGIMGIGSYEGVQTDEDGNVWLIEDAGGKVGDVNKHAKQPNSFVFRFVPADKADLLKGGVLQALQIMDQTDKPILFNDGKRDGDAMSQGMKDIHSFGVTLKTKWVIVHDTAKDGFSPFEANKAAKLAMASPLKRPENGVFRPGTDFSEFYFTETGDTNAETEAKEEFGGFGGILKLKQAAASGREGELSLVYRGNINHTGFDNLAFASADELMIVEDAGDKLHGQRKAFDCGYVLNMNEDYSKGQEPIRFMALGRDSSATIDSALGAEKDIGFQNSGDNEITGIHISDGDATAAGLLGAKIPNLADKAWRMFYTQQHGDNTTFEISRNTTM